VALDSSTVGLVGARRSRGGCDTFSAFQAARSIAVCLSTRMSKRFKFGADALADSGRYTGADPAFAAAAVGKAMTKRMTSAAIATKRVVTPPALREGDVVSVDKRTPFSGEGKQVVPR
jgi:hypothetical protein